MDRNSQRGKHSPDKIKTLGLVGGTSVSEKAKIGAKRTTWMLPAQPSSNPGCTCHLAGAICLACRRWDIKIRRIEARRASSLLRQALGSRIRVG